MTTYPGWARGRRAITPSPGWGRARRAMTARKLMMRPLMAALLGVCLVSAAGCRDAGEEFSASGTLEVATVAVRAPRLGVVEAILVEEGDVAYQGDPLASLDAELADLEVSAAAAALQVADARAAIGRQSAGGSLVAATADIDTALAAARSALIARQLERAALDIESPIDGVVLGRFFEPGEVVRQGEVLLEMADLEHLALRVWVPARRLKEVAVGETVDISVDALPGEAFRGIVASIADQAEFTPRNVEVEQQGAELLFRVQLTIANRDRRLRPGMTAKASWRNG